MTRPPPSSYTFTVESDTAFRLNGWLVDLVMIEHWSRGQGGAKFHGIRTALSILRHFVRSLQKARGDPPSPDHIEAAVTALRRLADYGYHVPPDIFPQKIVPEA